MDHDAADLEALREKPGSFIAGQDPSFPLLPTGLSCPHDKGRLKTGSNV